MSRLQKDFRECLRSNQPNEPSQHKAQRICEQTFSILRSRTLANTVTRWGSYNEYILDLIRVGDMAKTYCRWSEQSHSNGKRKPWFWAYRDPGPDMDVFQNLGPLFGDELAWLYNELGLAYFEEGSVVDALSVWDQGHEINRIIDQDPMGAQYLFQSYCNLGAANIQFGRLHIAEEYLCRARDACGRIGDTDHRPRIDAYLALVHHLRGDLSTADQGYKDALEELRRIGNPRAESVFLRHYGDLKLERHDLDRAEEYVRSAHAKAEDAHFPDLVAQARLSDGHRFRRMKKYQEAIREYIGCLEMARKYGIRSLEADALSELARLAVDLGDIEVGRRRAIKSLQIANELQLGLRQTHGLVILGNATAAAGHRDLGVAYLKLARQLAAQQQYWLRANEAESNLHRLGIADEEDDAARTAVQANQPYVARLPTTNVRSTRTHLARTIAVGRS